MRDKVLSIFRQELLPRPGDTVVCALSGGADSVALLHCLLSLRQPLHIAVEAAHFNHCLRGAESDEDEAFVRRLCQDWQVPLTVGRGDPRACSGKSLEEAARSLRYGFLLSQSGWIATAHHGDDQVETVLLNLLRGTGLQGLCGMAFRQNRILRPFLTVTRQEILSYVRDHRLPYRQDSSNAADEALRNRLRHHVIPLLQAENPSLTKTVGRMTGLLRQDEVFLAQQTDQLLAAAAKDGGYDCQVLLSASPVLRHRAIRKLLPCSKPSQSHVASVARLLEHLEGSASADLPGGYAARREYGLLYLGPKEEAAEFSPVTLRPGQCISLPALGTTVCCTGPVLLRQMPDLRRTFAIPCTDTPPCIRLRPRRTGDRIHLPGGCKTLKKWMIDRKIPAALRSRLPVMEDDHGIIAVYDLGADCTRSAHPGQTVWIIHFNAEETEQ